MKLTPDKTNHTFSARGTGLRRFWRCLYRCCDRGWADAADMYTNRWQRCASAVHAAADGRDEREKQLPFLGNDRLPRQARDKQKGKLKNRASSCRQDFDVSGPSAEHEHIVQLHQVPIPGTNGGSWCEKRSFQSHYTQMRSLYQDRLETNTGNPHLKDRLVQGGTVPGHLRLGKDSLPTQCVFLLHLCNVFGLSRACLGNHFTPMS